MSRYKTITEYVDVEMSLEEWETEELIEEIKSRGGGLVDVNPEMGAAIEWYKRGNIAETLEYLEQAFPELQGLSRKVTIK